MHTGYDKAYFAKLRHSSRSSAAVVVPMVADLVQPASVVDVGCGTGEWAAAFRTHGVGEVLGIDGPHLAGAELAIPPEHFKVADLTRPLRLDRRFDLAVSLEVAEHLPAEAADRFVASLTELAPLVLFSAAVPHQGGEHHVNEQWPDYWCERFARHGATPFDLFRRQLWQQADVEWWYAQNLLLFATADGLTRLAERGVKVDSNQSILPLVHPQNYLQRVWRVEVLRAAIDLAAELPRGARLILADDNRWGEVPLPGCEVVPFTQRDGRYAGPPADDSAAIAELEREVAGGSTHLAIASTARWQLEHYPRFATLLHQRHRLLLENERLLLFELC